MNPLISYNYSLGSANMKTWSECLFLTDKTSVINHFCNLTDILLIVGRGFDPRACQVAEALCKSNLHVSVLLVDYSNKLNNPEEEKNKSRSNRNYVRLKEICKNSRFFEKKIPLYSGDSVKKTLVISESVRSIFTKDFFQTYKHIIVDISAMPRGVGFSIVKCLMRIKEDTQKAYIAVCEDSSCDDNIRPVIVEESAEYLPGFNTFQMSLEQDDSEVVWFPVLGMNDTDAFNIIADFLKPMEICPVVPFPSQDVRRGENILRSCGEVLFRERGVEKRNVIYVPEKHPLLVYQKLFDTVLYYEKAFSIDNQRHVKYAFSSQSSKLIDMGLLLAIMDLEKGGKKVGIVVVENQGYQLNETQNSAHGEVYCLCLDDNIFAW